MSAASCSPNFLKGKEMIKNKQNKVDIINIMSTNNMPYVSFCEFDFVKDNLIPCRKKSELPQNAKTIILAIFPYKVKEARPEKISRYAAVPDYHTVCGGFLSAAANMLKAKFPNNEFRAFIDNSPIPEVAAAAHSGLGVLGNNGLLIHKTYGSFVFIGEIVTDLEIESDKGDKKCLDCGQCGGACLVNLRKADCLSAVNQQKNMPTNEQIDKIKNNGYIWGCDVCSEVCPMNKDVPITYISEFINGYRNEYKEGEPFENRAYAWRGIEVIKRNAEFFK